MTLLCATTTIFCSDLDKRNGINNPNVAVSGTGWSGHSVSGTGWSGHSGGTSENSTFSSTSSGSSLRIFFKLLGQFSGTLLPRSFKPG